MSLCFQQIPTVSLPSRKTSWWNETWGRSTPRVEEQASKAPLCHLTACHEPRCSKSPASAQTPFLSCRSRKCSKWLTLRHPISAHPCCDFGTVSLSAYIYMHVSSFPWIFDIVRVPHHHRAQKGEYYNHLKIWHEANKMKHHKNISRNREKANMITAQTSNLQQQLACT